MGLAGKLLLAILLGLAGNAVVWVCVLAGDGPVPRGLGRPPREREDIVELIGDWQARGVPLPVENSDRIPAPQTLLGGESLVIQIPDGLNLRSRDRVEFRTDSNAMTGLFSRMPDWHVRFDEGRCGSGAFVVFVSRSADESFRRIELTFSKRHGRWTGRVLSVVVGCG